MFQVSFIHNLGSQMRKLECVIQNSVDIFKTEEVSNSHWCLLFKNRFISVKSFFPFPAASNLGTASWLMSLKGWKGANTKRPKVWLFTKPVGNWPRTEGIMLSEKGEKRLRNHSSSTTSFKSSKLAWDVLQNQNCGAMELMTQKSLIDPIINKAQPEPGRMLVCMPLFPWLGYFRMVISLKEPSQIHWWPNNQIFGAVSDLQFLIFKKMKKDTFFGVILETKRTIRAAGGKRTVSSKNFGVLI